MTTSRHDRPGSPDSYWENVRMSHITDEEYIQLRKNALKQQKRDRNIEKFGRAIYERDVYKKQERERERDRIRNYEERFGWSNNICEKPRLFEEYLLPFSGQDSRFNDDLTRKMCGCDRGDDRILEDQMSAMSLAHENDDARLVQLKQILVDENVSPETKKLAAIEYNWQRRPYTRVGNRQRPVAGSRLSQMD
jgi:hypothetical protein